MNLTRRIIEGIHEVELDITPEFRKEPEPETGGVDVWSMEGVFKNLGWQRTDVDQSKIGVTGYTYTHPSIPEAKLGFEFEHHTSTVTKVVSQAGEEFETMDWEPSVDVVKKTTMNWLDIQGKMLAIDNIAHMLMPLGWVETSDEPIFGGKGRKARVFQHPKVAKSIRVTYEPKTGALVNALVLHPSGAVIESIDVSPEAIYKTAQELMKKAGV